MFVESCSAVKALQFLHAADQSDVVAVNLRYSPPFFSVSFLFSLFKGADWLCEVTDVWRAPKAFTPGLHAPRRKALAYRPRGGQEELVSAQCVARFIPHLSNHRTRD